MCMGMNLALSRGVIFLYLGQDIWLVLIRKTAFFLGWFRHSINWLDYYLCQYLWKALAKIVRQMCVRACMRACICVWEAATSPELGLL